LTGTMRHEPPGGRLAVAEPEFVVKAVRGGDLSNPSTAFGACEGRRRVGAGANPALQGEWLRKDITRLE